MLEKKGYQIKKKARREVSRGVDYHIGHGDNEMEPPSYTGLGSLSIAEPHAGE